MRAHTANTRVYKAFVMQGGCHKKRKVGVPTQTKKGVCVPTVGLEPTVPWLEARCLVRLATRVPRPPACVEHSKVGARFFFA